MAGIHKKSKPTPTEETIFTAEKALTAQQRAEQAKAEKAAQRAQKRAERAAMRQEMRNQFGDNSRIFRFVCIGLLVLVVAVAALVLVNNLGPDGWDEKEGVTYYLNSADLPDMPDDGIAAVANEVCYAENGGLLVHLTFANGEGTTQHPTKITLIIRNDNDELITAATASTIPENYFINSGGYKTFDLRVPKEYVKIADDPLSTLSFEITVESEEYTSLEGDSY
mgnify:FL=1